MTVHLAVLGSPIAHSLSPALHTAAIEWLGIDACYEAREVDADGMVVQAELARNGRLHGANITMPHKVLAVSLCDQVDSRARTIGSVNTWVVADGRITGHSTDGAGVRFAWKKAGLPTGGKVVVLGAGGAAVAAAAELATTHEVTLTARRPEAAAEAAARVGVNVVEWTQPCAESVVVNATSIGMHGEMVAPRHTDDAIGFLEMVYGPGETATESALRERGIPVASGRQMLLGQAAASFTLWFGVEAPVTVMEEALNASRARWLGPKPPPSRRY